MRQIASQQSKDIFRQLAELSSADGVKTIIANQDAWVASDAVADELTAAVRFAAAARPHTPQVARRISEQRSSLNPLVTSLRKPFSHAV